jgi:hypothetical protein
MKGAFGRCRNRSICLFLGGLAGIGALAGSGCPDPMNGEEPIFPANYRETYRLVRNCRSSVEHTATIRVWINESSADAYLADANPLPVGTIVVKEEYAGSDCSNDAELEFWSVMRKEAAGFDPANGDWNFHEYGAPDRTRTATPASTCITCHQNADCVARDFMCTEP